MNFNVCIAAICYVDAPGRAPHDFFAFMNGKHKQHRNSRSQKYKHLRTYVALALPLPNFNHPICRLT